MNFAYYANLRAFELIFRGFGLTTAESTYHKETFERNFYKKTFLKILQPEVTAGCQRWKFFRNRA